MGMIEDMDAAVLWLSSVSVRFVSVIQQTKEDTKSDGVSTQTDKKEKTKKRYVSLMNPL
jgi:hypothetical protein